MKAYADTNFFTAILVETSRTGEAVRLLESVKLGVSPALPISILLRMEIVNALQRMVFEARHGTQTFRMSGETAAFAESSFMDELELGGLWRRDPLTNSELEPAFHTLAHRHTAKHGFRTYDILHVASALLLGCDAFWSFDTKAKHLAQLEGLKIN